MTEEKMGAIPAEDGPERMTPPAAKRVPYERTFHGDTFTDPYEWLRDKDDPEVRDYVAAQNAYCERRTAALAPLRDTLLNELKSRIQQTDMSVPTRMDGYWYFTRTREGAQYAVQCRLPIRGEDDWTPPDVDPMGEPGSMPGEQVVFDTNREAEGHDFFQVGGMDLSRDGRWMLYGVDTHGDERYDFRIRDLETGEELPDVLEGIAGACITPDARWVFYAVLDEAWRPCAVRRHRVGMPVADDVEVFREDDERFWLGVGLSFDERNVVIGTGSKTTTEVLMLPIDTPEGEFRAIIPREPDIEYDVSFARFEGRRRTAAIFRWPSSTTMRSIRISRSTSSICEPTSRRTGWARACASRRARPTGASGATASKPARRPCRSARRIAIPATRRSCRARAGWASRASPCTGTMWRSATGLTGCPTWL